MEENDSWWCEKCKFVISQKKPCRMYGPRVQKEASQPVQRPAHMPGLDLRHPKAIPPSEARRRPATKACPASSLARRAKRRWRNS